MKALKLILLLCVALMTTFVVVTRVPAIQNALLEFTAPRAMMRDIGDSSHLRIYVCGSASPLGVSRARAQACLAVLTPEHFYLFDVGAGSVANLQADGLPLQRLDGVFLTHYHSDHIADLPAARLNSWVAGRPQPLQVFGPEGVEQVVAGFNLAYTLDSKYRTEHHGEALLPAALGILEAQQVSSGTVFDDGRLKITMFEVGHSPVHPAVGYSIEYAGNKVVISGDTTVVDATFEFAAGADLLFHDALSRSAIEPMINAANQINRTRLATIMVDVTDYHADLLKLQNASEQAGVQQLVLYHMVPTPTNPLLQWIWQRDLKGNTMMADDGMMFELPAK